MSVYRLRHLCRPSWSAVVIVTLLLGAGCHVRAWTFRHTWPIRFAWDQHNAWSQGSAALELGQGDFFDGIVAMYRPERKAYLDYAPGRMYLMTAWVWSIRHVHGADVRRTDRAIYPMLAFNFGVEILGALGLYRLCRLFRGRAASLLAVCCLWFNPAVIHNTSGWVQWDIWMNTPLLWAMWATLRRGRPRGDMLRDLFAGLCLGVGAMLKGQILLGVAWFPLMAAGMSLLNPHPFHLAAGSRRQHHVLVTLEASTRLALQTAGFLLAVAVITLPFSLRGSTDWFRVFQAGAGSVRPMVVSAWNLPGILAARYGCESTWLVKLYLLGHTITFSMRQELEYGFLAWMLLIALLSIRARHHRHVLLAVPAVYMAALALLPGMHERYVLWGAAPLAAAVCVGPAATIIYVIVTALAFGCPLRVCLDTNHAFAPQLKCFLDAIGVNAGWLWLACAVGLTVLLAQRPTPAWHPDPRVDKNGVRPRLRLGAPAGTSDVPL